MTDRNSLLIKEFIDESSENLARITSELVNFESKELSQEKDEILNSIYRSIHTLKGSASFLGYKNLERLSHSIEFVLDHLRSKDFVANEYVIDVLLSGFDLCKSLIKEIEEQNCDDSNLVEDLVVKLNSLIEFNITNETHLIDEIYFDENFQKMSNETIKHDIQEQTLTLEKEDQYFEQELSSSSKNDQTVRVNVNLLDKILNVVGELVLNRNQILQLSKESEEPDLTRLSNQLNVITTELQTDIMTTRMQPLATIFDSTDRLVRDVSKVSNKKVDFESLGRETELDKTLIEVIRDPITHLIRNAIDHGIETPDLRQHNGKNETGKILVKSYQSGGQVIIEISDDGKGINHQLILKKAIEKGLVSSENAKSLTKQNILNFIFHPGFSTAEQVTKISGRGVGMDIVKSNIEKVGGQCEVDTQEGQGTTFKIKIPLTLAIIPALIVESHGHKFAIPQKNLVELVLLDEAAKADIEEVKGTNFIRLRDQLIPIYGLAKGLGFHNDLYQENDLNIVILNSETGVYGLIVDEVLETQEIVVKPLTNVIRKNKTYAGATIMGDGSVALILDALGLLGLFTDGPINVADKQIEKISMSEEETNVNKKEEILLFTLTDNRKYGVPLSLVSRLEEFDYNAIEKSMDQTFVRYRNKAMPIIDLNKEINNSKIQEQTVNHDSSKSLCFVSNLKGTSCGFIVNEIKDISKNYAVIDYTIQNDKNFMGTTYIDDELITVLDIHNIANSNYKLVDTPELSHNKILLVEDSKLYQRVIQECLETSGYNVVLAENGEEGIKLLHSSKHKFDLVITDIEMPKMNGFELIESIRTSDSSTNKIPIIAVTTRVGQKDLAKTKSLGVSAHLEKLNKENVLYEVKKYLNVA